MNEYLFGYLTKDLILCYALAQKQQTRNYILDIQNAMSWSAGNVSLLTREAVHINPETGELADPNCAAAKLWMPKYEPGWELGRA